jgi:hypothetical protein
MEGLWKTWRHQTIINNSPDLDSYGKPLPPPPIGFYWSRLEDGSWKLNKFEEVIDADGDSVLLQSPAVLEHVIMPEDTMQGICLKYRVSAVTLRQYNNFSGTAFRSKKSLRIPLDAGMRCVSQPPTQDVVIQKFMNITNEPREEAMFYLEDHNFDLMEALAAINGDTQWLMEHEQKHAPPSAPPLGARDGIGQSGVELVKPTAIAYTAEAMSELAMSPEEEVRVPLLG